jgi:hypothetical protein
VYAKVFAKDDNDDNVKLVWLPTSLCKNFDESKVSKWGDMLRNGRKLHFCYVQKQATSWGCGYKFVASWTNKHGKIINL